VARGAYRDERHALAARLELGQGGEAGTGGPAGRHPRVATCVRVGVDVSASLRAERIELVEVRACVHTGEYLEWRFAELGVNDLVPEVEVPHALHHGKHAHLSFGVARATVVLDQAGRAGHDERRRHDTTPFPSARHRASRASAAAW